MSVDAAEAVLAWYDRNARRLPWRAPPGDPPRPAYEVWLSEIMLQQTTTAAVRSYFATFMRRWPSVEALAAADDSEVMSAWAGLGYYARARNLLLCARKVSREHGGRFPEDEGGLRMLPGIGAYTAAAVTAIALGQRAVVVDGNVERVVSRLFAVEDPLPGARPKLYRLTDTITPALRAGDFAQGMMDLGATICTPRGPLCALCPLAGTCAAHRLGTPERFPVKPAKKARPHRHGMTFWLEQDGHVLLQRRPARGLLGGMRGLPTTDWAERPSTENAPVNAEWKLLGRVNHVFTHFSLDLDVLWAPASARDAAGDWWPIDRLDDAGLPTVFAKAVALAAGLRQETWQAERMETE